MILKMVVKKVVATILKAYNGQLSSNQLRCLERGSRAVTKNKAQKKGSSTGRSTPIR
jgi:hypothetical protein